MNKDQESEEKEYVKEGKEREQFVERLRKENFDAIYMIGLLGDTFTNEELRKYTKKHISDTKMIIGVDFLSKILIFNDKKVKLQIWRIPYALNLYITGQYIRGAMGVIVMYDSSDVGSLNKITEWIQLIKNNWKYEQDAYPILLVGTRSNADQQLEVSMKQIEQFKEEQDISESMEVSVDKGENVEEMFLKLTELMMKRYLPKSPDKTLSVPNSSSGSDEEFEKMLKEALINGFFTCPECNIPLEPNHGRCPKCNKKILWFI